MGDNKAASILVESTLYHEGTHLPKTIRFQEGYIENGYFYNGVKYSKQRFDEMGNLLESETYFDNLVLRNGRPYRILHDEGYINLTELGQIEDKNYHIKDHLGNVRAVIKEDITGKPDVFQAKTYYPFGMVYTSEIMNGAFTDKTNPYLYNGKEQQEMPGLWFDYGARFYDPQLGRFTGIDPIAEKFYHVTTYNYAENSPISNIDLWGLQKLFFQKALNKNQNFKKVNDIQRKTTGGKSFTTALKSQSKYNAFYYEFNDALPAGKHNAFKNKNEFLKAKKNDSYGVFKDVNETDIDAAFENGEKGVIAIGIEKVTSRDVESKDKLGEKVFTLNHEEVAHGTDVLKEGGNNSSNTEDHEKFFGESETYSPTYKEVLNNEKYEGTKARKQAEEINTLIEDDKK